MKWNSRLAIGIDAIDNQHKQTFEHLLALESSVAKRDPWHIVRFLLSQLAEYMKFHLAVEEAMLEIVRYSQQSDHCQAHAKIMDQIADLEKQLQRAGSETNLVNFFEDWFIRHVLSDDRQYVDYVKKESPALLGQTRQ